MTAIPCEPPEPSDSTAPPQACGETISAIEVVSGNPNLRRVKAGRRTVATLPDGDVEALNIAIGQPWTDAHARHVARFQARVKIEKAALGMLGRRSHATVELRRKLIAKDHAEDLVGEVIARLLNDGWLDDRQHAEALLQEAFRTGGAARSFLIEKLIARDVPGDIAEMVVAESMDASQELESAIELAKQKLKSMPAHEKPGGPERPGGPGAPGGGNRRIAGALARKGYDEDTIRNALENLGIELE